MASAAHDMHTRIDPRNYRADQGFFLALSVVLALLTATGFAQLALRGITDPVGAPLRVHVHALLLISWLALFCTQNWLAAGSGIALHRKLGWASLLLVAAIVGANYYVTIMALVEHRVATPPSAFLALGTADTLPFAGLIAWAVIKRRETQWHRRLMIGATLVPAAAGFNRLMGDLPLPASAVASIGCQLAFVALIAWHDRRVFGRVHSATAAIAAIVLLQRLLPLVLPMFEPWNDLVTSILG